MTRIHPFTAAEKENGKAEGGNRGKKKDSSDLLKARYDIEDDDTKQTFQVAGKDLFRNKRTFTRDRLKVFLKLATEMRNNMLRVKLAVVEKYKLAEVNFSDMTIGQMPEFTITPLKRTSKSLPAAKKADKVKENNNSNTNNSEHRWLSPGVFFSARAIIH